MKKIPFSLLAIAFAASLCFAQESEETSASASQSATSTPQAETKSFTGKVKVVSVGNVEEGKEPQITVTDDNGQNLSFVIETVAILTAADIKNGSKVTVTYTTDANGTNKVQSIKLVE